MVDNVSPADVERIITKARLVFVDAWADWCQPCKALTPILQELDTKYADNPDIKFIKLNTQAYSQFAMDNQIHAIPCVLMYFDGEPAKYEVTHEKTGEKKVLDRLIGLRPTEHYEDAISYFFS